MRNAFCVIQPWAASPKGIWLAEILHLATLNPGLPECNPQRETLPKVLSSLNPDPKTAYRSQRPFRLKTAQMSLVGTQTTDAIGKLQIEPANQQRTVRGNTLAKRQSCVTTIELPVV